MFGQGCRSRPRKYRCPGVSRSASAKVVSRSATPAAHPLSSPRYPPRKRWKEEIATSVVGEAGGKRRSPPFLPSARNRKRAGGSGSVTTSSSCVSVLLLPGFFLAARSTRLLGGRVHPLPRRRTKPILRGLAPVVGHRLPTRRGPRPARLPPLIHPS